MVVTGVHFAGQQSGNVGTAFQGIFGTLTVNANGTYSYVLDNQNANTDLLVSGETALERFTITYRIGGVTQTLAVEIAINGLDEPGQDLTIYDESIRIEGDFLIERDERILFQTPEGYLQAFSDEHDPMWIFTVRGSVASIANGEHPFSATVGASPPQGRTINEGRIVAENLSPDTVSTQAVIGFGENYGVASASYSGGEEPGTISSRAIGWSGLLVNNGLVEVVSNLDAYGVWAQSGHGIVNSGVIYVEGGASYNFAAGTDPLGIIGFRSGGTGGVVNSGTVHVVSNTPLVESVGFRFFMNSTNIYNPVNFDNSGTIVADRAIEVSGNFRSSTYLDNSGLIEGDIDIRSGVNQLYNLETGVIRGDVLLGLDPDTLVNSGTIIGDVDMNQGGDFYIGLGGGSVSGTVSGGLGTDRFHGGNSAERFSGGDGNDWLEGGLGADRLTGGAGADVFYYRNVADSTSSQRDTITDFQSGVDRIDISALGISNFTLTATSGGTLLRAGALEVLITGSVSSSDIVTTPPEYLIDGSDGDDLLVGRENDAALRGFAGNDTLHGGAGQDFLDGGIGADSMYGGAGDDVYILDNSGDLIVEFEDGGIDEIQTFVSTILPTFVENGTLLGDANISISGNQLDNVLVGNSGSNILRGNGGTDIVIGGGGLDFIYMNFGDVTAVYEQVSDSAPGAPDRLLSVDPTGDRIDLSALEVIGFTIGEYRRGFAPGGASSRLIDLTVVQVETTDGVLEFEVGGLPGLGLDMFIWDRAEGEQAHLSGLDLDDILNGSSGSDVISGLGGDDTISGMVGNDILRGNGGSDQLFGGEGLDELFGGDDPDFLTGGLGNDTIDGGSNVDTALVSGNRSQYTVTQTSTGVFEVTGPDGTDTLTAVEFLQFDDQTMRLLPGTGVTVNFDSNDPGDYQAAMNAIRDFDGNDLGGQGSWLLIGSIDVNGDGDIDHILVNDAIGRFATVGTAPDGLVYFDDHSWAGETRVAGIYIDPLVESGEVVQGSDFDSQRRFQNDLEIENINRVLGADDYDGDGIWEVYFALTDGTAYLRALMHADGNIRYANYQSEEQVRDYLTSNGYDENTFGDWFSNSTGSADTTTFVNVVDSEKTVEEEAPGAPPALVEHAFEVHDRPVDEWQAEFFG